MKKLLKSLAISVVIVLMFAMAVSAVGTAWTFDDEASALNWADKASNSGTVGYEDGCMVISITGGDPYFQHGLTSDEQFDAAKYPYVKVKYKIIGGIAPIAEFFWGSDVNPGPVAETNMTFDLVGDENWNEYVVCIADTSFGTWEGIIDNFRIDPLQGDVTSTEIVYVDYIAFFETEAEALAWQPTAAAPAAEEAAAPAAEEAAAPAAEEAAAPAADAAAAPVTAPAAAQTADAFSVAIITLAVATAAGVVICRKSR